MGNKTSTFPSDISSVIIEVFHLKGDAIMVDNELPLIEFSAEDRCDRCGAQAYTMAQHDQFGELLFCLHHRRDNADDLLDEGWTIIDDYEAMSRLSDNNPVFA